MTQEAIEYPVYFPDADDRIRILIEYEGSWRPVFWFKVARDGSIYLGPRYVDITLLRHGVAQPLEGGQFRVSYDDGAKVTDPELMKTAKLSLHASGIINTPIGRFTGVSLRSITNQQLLCLATFQHPSAFDGIGAETVKKRDVCLRYPVEESCPLWCQLFAGPKEKVQLVSRPSAVFQIILLFNYEGLSGVPDLLLQLVIGHGAAGPWPPHSYLVFPVLNPEVGGSNV
jgi:hypothetical protein